MPHIDHDDFGQVAVYSPEELAEIRKRAEELGYPSFISPVEIANQAMREFFQRKVAFLEERIAIVEKERDDLSGQLAETRRQLPTQSYSDLLQERVNLAEKLSKARKALEDQIAWSISRSKIIEEDEKRYNKLREGYNGLAAELIEKTNDFIEKLRSAEERYSELEIEFDTMKLVHTDEIKSLSEELETQRQFFLDQIRDTSTPATNAPEKIDASLYIQLVLGWKDLYQEAISLLRAHPVQDIEEKAHQVQEEYFRKTGYHE